MLTQEQMNKLSPMMRQYLEVKEQHRDQILFFRLGDFYEMFNEDAQVASYVRCPLPQRRKLHRPPH